MELYGFMEREKKIPSYFFIITKSFLLRKVAVDRHPFYRYFFFFGGFYVAGLKSVGVVMDEVVSIL